MTIGFIFHDARLAEGIPGAVVDATWEPWQDKVARELDNAEAAMEQAVVLAGLSDLEEEVD